MIEMSKHPKLDWFQNSDLKALAIAAWDEYKKMGKVHYLYRYFALLDEAYCELYPEECIPTLSNSDSQQPSNYEEWE
jgi:hypothetical protein